MPHKEEFSNPEILREIYQLKVDGLSDSKVAEKIKERFGVKIFRTTVKKLFTKYRDMVRTPEGVALKEDIKISDWDKRIEDKFNRIDKATNKLMDALEQLGDKLTPELYIQLAPTILLTCREILNQLNFLKKQQEEVMKVQKSVQLTPLQMMEAISREVQKKRKEEEKDKKQIFIIEDAPRTE